VDVAGLRHFTGSMYFLTDDARYTWLNTVVGVMEGRYARDPEGFLIGTFQVYECVPESNEIEPRTAYHEGLAPQPRTQPRFA
jgi:hypothetical protein